MKKTATLLLLLIVFLFSACTPNSPENAPTETIPTEVMESIPTEAPPQPPTVGFLWNVSDGIAYLLGIGTVTDSDILIPSRVFLTKTENSWTESISGTEYPVVVTGEAFRNCDSLKTVTFSDGVSIENNAMHVEHLGMFLDCSNLEAVYNLPDSVTSMANTFKNCAALKTISNFPTSVEDLSYCFAKCTRLNQLPDIPDSVTNMRNCFMQCYLLTSVPDLPDSVTDLTETFLNCKKLKGIPKLPNGVTALNRTFEGCTSLTEVTKIPDSVVSMEHTFRYCGALVVPPVLSNSVTSMLGCFQECYSLELPPEMPDSVQDMFQCFSGCRSLQQVPNIPDSLVRMDDCFNACISLTGEILIPEKALCNATFEFALPGSECKNLDTLILECCPMHPAVDYFIDLPLKITYLRSHTEGEICPLCNTQTEYVMLDHIVIITDNVPDVHRDWLVDYLDTQVPEPLKEHLNRVVLTDDIDRHLAPDYPYRGRVAGFANGSWICLEFPSSASPLSYAKKQRLTYTLYHELGHVWDFIYSFVSGIPSQSDEWDALFQAEGQEASKWYGSLYQEYDDFTRHQETFAIAVGKYFTDPNALQQHCPGMYEYMDALFRNIIADKNAA